MARRQAPKYRPDGSSRMRDCSNRSTAVALQSPPVRERPERTWMISPSIVVAARRGRARRNARGERCASRQLWWVGTRCSLWRG